MIQQVPLPENSVAPGTRGQWRRWLERNHESSAGVWVVARRKQATGRTPDPDQLVEEALCFGWSDVRSRSLDDVRQLVWLAPRKPGAGWSRRHKELVGRLADAGRLAPAGIACVKAAKRSGAWTLLDALEELRVPPDLARALRAHGSAGNFERLAPSARRHALEWIQGAKRPETRAARVEETARLAKMDIVMTQWRLNSRR
jgi:uncharacterized protein YdeI (YjbR/CyaY-like superfamily)